MLNKLALLCLFSLQSSAVFAEDLFKYEDQVAVLVKPFQENHIFQAASVGIILGDQTWIRHYGTLTERLNKAPNDESLYEIGSITKVFTGILLADAVANKNLLKLEQTVGECFPELSKSNPKFADRVTLQQLSQHVSGLPRMPGNIRPSDPNNPFADYDRKLLLEFLSTVTLANEPGAKHEYSNLAVGFLGDLIATKSDMEYEELLKSRIFEPLNMHSSGMTLAEDEVAKLAPPFNSALIPDHRWDFAALAGAGAIRSNIADMLKFAKAQLDPPQSDVKNAINLAWEISSPASKEQPAMGLGWLIAGDGSTRWHNGQTGGYHSMLLVSRDLNAAVVLLSNTATQEMDALAEGIFQTVVGMKVAPRVFAKEFDVDAATIERLKGDYQLAPGLILTITASDGRVLAQLTGQQALRIYPESESVWNYRDVQAQLRFELEGEDAAAKVTLHQNGRVMPAPRINK